MESKKHESHWDSSPRPGAFLDLPASALSAFDSIKSLFHYPHGTTLFKEGQPVRGIFILCNGRAKLSVCSKTGERLTLRVARPGDVLGLSASMSGRPYELSAETLDNTQVIVVLRKDLMRFLGDHREACLQVLHLLSQDLDAAYDRLRSANLRRTRRVRASTFFSKFSLSSAHRG
jgi:CRP/FNR family cyclic AMP-dependent transcriptional regulator